MSQLLPADGEGRQATLAEHLARHGPARLRRPAPPGQADQRGERAGWPGGAARPFPPRSSCAPGDGPVQMVIANGVEGEPATTRTRSCSRRHRTWCWTERSERPNWPAPARSSSWCTTRSGRSSMRRRRRAAGPVPVRVMRPPTSSWPASERGRRWEAACAHREASRGSARARYRCKRGDPGPPRADPAAWRELVPFGRIIRRTAHARHDVGAVRRPGVYEIETVRRSAT